MIRDLFVSDVTRDIPPVVYFHEQSPAKLATRSREYIITGGWPEDHPNHRRVPDGIHEQYVRLLTRIAAELDKTGGPELPTPGSPASTARVSRASRSCSASRSTASRCRTARSLAEALLAARHLAASRRAARRRGASSAEGRPARRRVRHRRRRARQRAHPRRRRAAGPAAARLLRTEPLVADFELRLERDGEWARFETTAPADARHAVGRGRRTRQLAEEDFSHVMSRDVPGPLHRPDELVHEPRRHARARASRPRRPSRRSATCSSSARPGATLFLVVDEVSQYVLSNKDRVDRLRAFATALGASAQGQGVAARARPAEARRGGRRLVPRLGEGPLPAEAARPPRADEHPRRRPQAAAAEEARGRGAAPRAVRAAPARPQALRLRLRGDHAGRVRRGLPDAARAHRPAPADHHRAAHALDPRPGRRPGHPRPAPAPRRAVPRPEARRQPVGALVTLDQIYEVQHTALDSDVQATHGAHPRASAPTTRPASLVRAAKAVALLELIQDIDADRREARRAVPLRPASTAATRSPRSPRRSKSCAAGTCSATPRSRATRSSRTAGEEWERERRDIGVAREAISDDRAGRRSSSSSPTPDRPRLQGRPFPWAAVFSDGRRADDISLVNPPRRCRHPGRRPAHGGAGRW